MPGTFRCRPILALALTLALPLAAGTRRHEVQFRRNDYAAPAAPALLQAAGLAKAILRVFSDDERKGGLYFPGSPFAMARPALASWVAAYDGGPVPLWAWMGTRKFAWFGDQRLLDRQWRDGREHMIPKLDLFNPEALELQAALLAALARQPVRGILLQDDLTLLQGEGFSGWGKAAFARASGVAADPRSMLKRGTAQQRAWQELKVARVGEALRRIVAACRRARPGIEIGLNVHYEAPLTPERARAWYAFDAAAAAAGVDLFYLMAYPRQMQAEMGLAEGENRLHFRRLLEAALRLWGEKLVVKLQARDWRTSEPIPLEELQAYYDLIPAGVERVCFAAADPEDIELISKVIADRSSSVSVSVSDSDRNSK